MFDQMWNFTGCKRLSESSMRVVKDCEQVDSWKEVYLFVDEYSTKHHSLIQTEHSGHKTHTQKKTLMEDQK